MTASPEPNEASVRLDKFSQGNYSPGAPLITQILWYFVGAWIVRCHILPYSAFKVFVLRSFGASIGSGVRVKPGVRVKFPWRLRVGNNSWIGEDVWIDNLAPVEIGSNCCLSQGVLLCTGNHDWTKQSFDLVTRGISIHDGAWIAARSTVAPGAVVGAGAVITLQSVVSGEIDPWGIYSGEPLTRVGTRTLSV